MENRWDSLALRKPRADLVRATHRQIFSEGAAWERPGRHQSDPEVASGKASLGKSFSRQIFGDEWS